MAQWLKIHLPMQEVRVPSLEDPLEKEMATHSSILAWEIPWTQELGEVTKELDMTKPLNNNKTEPQRG